MKSTNEGPKMLLPKKSTHSKKTPAIKPRERRHAALPPWLKLLPWFVPWFILHATFDADIQIHSDAPTMIHAHEK